MTNYSKAPAAISSIQSQLTYQSNAKSLLILRGKYSRLLQNDQIRSRCKYLFEPDRRTRIHTQTHTDARFVNGKEFATFAQAHKRANINAMNILWFLVKENMSE